MACNVRLVHRFTAGLLLSAVVVSAAPASAQGPIQWGCDAPTGKICYFSLQSGGAVRNFSLGAGRKTMVLGVTPGRDYYFASIDAPNLGDANRCRQLNALGHTCQRKTVDSSYND